MSKRSRKYDDMDAEELKKSLSSLKQELVKLNNQRASSTNSKVASDIRNSRRDIARIKTLLNAKFEQKSK
ncbi:MAG TPA: 50S ribosomal protein L29 [Candidatus Woesearchaeota archaeon]|nr:50S ribosomal protein L29 [Candidatus Woesearchaeota archaeon]